MVLGLLLGLRVGLCCLGLLIWLWLLLLYVMGFGITIVLILTLLLPYHIIPITQNTTIMSPFTGILSIR